MDRITILLLPWCVVEEETWRVVGAKQVEEKRETTQTQFVFSVIANCLVLIILVDALPKRCHLSWYGYGRAMVGQ